MGVVARDNPTVSLFRPSRSRQNSAVGVAPSRSRAIAQPRCSDEIGRCEPRAKRAVGAQRRTLHGDAPSAHDSERDGSQSGLTEWPPITARIAPTLSGRFSRQMKCDKRPHRTVTRRGVNDPIGQSQGGTYRPIPGSFTPRLHLSNLMRAPCGRHRTPSERVGAAGASSHISTCCLRHAGPRVPANLLRTDLLLLVTTGTT